MGIGFSLLGAVLWHLLSECRTANDVHNGKIIMILSQTFYRNIHRQDADDGGDDEKCDGVDEERGKARDSNDSQAPEEISRDRRQYLKELLIAHPIWGEGRFWEQALWQCVLEQVRRFLFLLFCSTYV